MILQVAPPLAIPEFFSVRALPSFPVTFIRGPAFRAGLRDGDEGLSSETGLQGLEGI